MCGVEKSTLIYYDKIGFFSPDTQGENGYRYYSLPQIPELEAIVTLSKMGMSLKEIQNYMNHRSPRELINVLDSMSDKITEKIIDLLREKQLIDAKRSTTEEGMLNPLNEIFIKDMPEEYYMVAPYAEGVDAKSWYTAEALHSLNMKKRGIMGAYTVGSIWKTYDSGELSDSIPEFLQIRVLQKENPDEVFIKPAGKYMMLYTEGGYSASFEGHKKMLEYAQNNHYEMDKYLFKDIIHDELSKFEDSEHLLRLSVRIL